MKKLLLFIVCTLSIIGCSTDDNLESDIISKLEITLKEKNEPDNLIYKVEYVFDKQGKVVSENLINYYTPQFVYYSTFEYNNKGQVIKEFSNGEILYNVVWTNDFAEVFNNQNQKTSEFTFDGEKLMSYRMFIGTSNEITRKMNYDVSGNVISIGDETEIFVEFLNYDISKKNPDNYIKSIGLLRIDSNPYFKNIFDIRKQYPWQGDDFSVPLTFYNFNYKFDTQNRVFQIENEFSAIYTEEFIYTK
ncbi:MAG: hypothetical protein ACI924_000570 [Flavobacterium sp.]|jgi:hypothetical protein